MPIVADPRYTGANIGAATRDLFLQPRAPEEPPRTLDVLAAGARQSHLAGALYERITNADPDIDTPVDYNPLDDIAGFEDKAHEFVNADSKSDVEGIKSRITSRQRDIDVLHRAGLGGTATEFVMNITDPSFLVAAAVPELAGAKLLQMRSLVLGSLEGAAGAGAYEAGMHMLQEDRTALESALNIGGGAVIGGTLGKLQGRMPARELNAVRSAADETLIDPMRSEVGAASSQVSTTLAQEAPAPGTKQLLKVSGKLPFAKTDMQVVFDSQSLNAQQLLESIAEIPILKQKNVEGIATRADSVESRVIQSDAQIANLQDEINGAFISYRDRGGALKPNEFAAEVSKALRRGDKSPIAEVEPIVARMRDLFDKPADRAKAAGILEDPVKKAEERAETEAVEQYVKVETSQIYGDYRAKALSEQLSKRQFARMAKTQVADDVEGAVPEALDAGNAVRDIALQNAVRSEQGATETVLGRAALRRKQQEAIDKAYAAYVKRTRPVSKAKFSERAQKARTAPDTNADVNRMAKLLTDKERGALKGKAKARSVDKDVATKPLGAESYFRRMYDRDAIRKSRAAWDSTLLKWFMNDGAAREEATAAAEDVTRQILGADVGQSNFNVKVSVPQAGPLQARTLAIPDVAIEQFLVNDPVKVARAYLRDMIPQIEMAERFGERDMKAALEGVAHEYDVMRQQLRDKAADDPKLSEKLSDLQTEEKATIDALIRVRDRILNRATKSPQSEGGRAMVNAVRHWRNLVAASKLGGTAIVSVPQDLARIASQYGFVPTMTKLTKLIASPEFRALSKTQARRVGAAVEVAMSRRVQDAFDGAYTEGWSQTLAQSVYKYTGLNHWTDFSRTLTGTLLEDRVLKSATNLAGGKQVEKFTLTRLAQLGLGEDELRSIATQAEKHGAEVDGVRTSGSAHWDDGNLAQTYDAAILKESRQNVLQPGAANRVWWMDSEVGKTIGQLKTFSLASGNSYSGAIAASLGQKQYLHAAKFIGFMMIGGYLAHAFRQTAAGFAPETNPAAAAREAVSESGLLGVMPDVLSPASRLIARGMVRADMLDPAAAETFGQLTKYSDRSPASALGGPSVGAAFDTWDVMFNRLDNGLSAKDLHAIRRLMPFQNVWFLRRMINALEGETADALGLEGATGDAAVDRFAQTEEFRKAS